LEGSSHDVNGLWWKGLVVAAVSFGFFAYHIEQNSVASALANPVDGGHAQDESIYANIAMRMAAQGNWLTPIVMGRIYLVKPPLLEIFTGLSLKTLGLSLFALRLPCLLAASLAVGLLFSLSWRFNGVWAGTTVALLLLSNSIWYTFARLCYTDVLLAFFTVCAMYSLALDPSLELPTARWGFILSDTAAILTKSVAGVLPLLVLGLFVLLSPRAERPSLSRAGRTIAWIALLAAPWHVYQLVVHRQWFWTDYVQTQLFQFGVKPTMPQTSETTIWFYIKRLYLTDPFLSVLAALTLPALAIAIAKRNTFARLLACWLAVVLVSIIVFQWRNLPYIVMLMAPLVLLAAGFVPARYQRYLVGALALVFMLKLATTDRLWSLAYSSRQPLVAAPLLRSYADRHRSNELILVNSDDEFYSSTLPLPKVRYCFLDPDHVAIRYAPYYVDLGITVSTAVFDDLGRWEPMFRDRLRSWGLDSDEPIATTIVADSERDVLNVIQTHPASDFYLPAHLLSAVGQATTFTHDLVSASPDRSFLLARKSPESAPSVVPRWRLPKNW
jgi:dolichyl-phosphate-mannose-protein mannosyltransferase